MAPQTRRIHPGIHAGTGTTAGPRMHHVESSLVEAVGYDPDRRELHVRLIDAGLYVYAGVDQACFDGFLHADSKGAYFNREVKGRGFPFEHRG